MSFQSLYKKLNLEQKKAVDMIEGPIMVIAGPGTGKTRVLTLRIANILKKTDIEPENILALTFTESGVNSIRNKLIDIIGSDAYSVSIFTFHGFCNYLIQEYPEDFPLFISSSNISEVEQVKIIQEILSELKLDYLKPFGDQFFYVKFINSAIEKLKREGIEVEDFSKILVKEKKDFWQIDDLYNKGVLKGKYQKVLKRIEKNEELVQVYQKYQERLQELNLYDYNDMIISVLNLFSKSKEFLLKVQEQYLYFLVDEHQDTNNAQNKILELLGNFHQNPNIFVVGDPKQAIYRFQGASLENFHYFKKLYPSCRVIEFSQNYRSSQKILDAADNIIPSLKLKSNNNFKEKIDLNIFPDFFSEKYFLAKNIMKKGTVAILCRENKDVFEFSEALKKEGIDFSIDSDQDILKDNDIKKIILLLRLINDFHSKELFFEALHIDFLNINPLDIYKNYSCSKIKEFSELIGSLVIDSKNYSLPEFFERLIEKTGFLSYALKSERKINKLNAFFNEIKSFFQKNREATLRDFLEYLDLLKKYNILIKKKFDSQKRIRIMTAHRAKGLEFDYVYIIKVLDKTWGNKRVFDPLKLSPNVFSLTGKKIEEKDPNDDERRLFYVALTRARKKVFISCFKKDLDQKEKLPSLFLKDIKKDLLNFNCRQEEKKIFRSFKKEKPIKDKDLILNLFQKRGLSVTGLNNYLSCPWKYFYNNLLRMPKAKENHQMYGTAIHKALKDFFDREEDLLKKFEYYLKEEPMKKKDFQRFLKRGKKALKDYLKKDHDFNVLTELNISIVFSGLKLQGKIDKLEFSKEGVNVVDYKTGKTKSRNQIEGKTKNSQGDIKRQLVFYKLLLDNYKKKKYNMTSGEIDFVEPNEKGKFKKEKFLIGEKEIKELKELVEKVSQEIVSLSFWDKKCDDKNCRYCQLREMMK